MLYPDCSYITNPKIHILYQKGKKKNYHAGSLSDYYVQSFEGGGEEGEIRDSHFIAGLYLKKEEFAVMTSIDL